MLVAITREVSPSLGDCQLTHVARTPIDVKRAEAQHRAYQRALAALGCRVLDGGGMAVFQAVDAFRLFTGLEPDADRMLAHFTALVEGPESDLRVR